MKYSLEDLRDKSDFLQYCFVNALTKIPRKKFNSLLKSNQDGKYDIKLIVGGVEIPLIETFKEVEKQRDRIIKEEAGELVQEKLNDIECRFSDLLEDVKDKLLREIL